ncbi:MAG: hypothetical protein V4671_31940 [Armatimonadota bacterium]
MAEWADNQDWIGNFTIGTWNGKVGAFGTVETAMQCLLTNYKDSGTGTSRESSTLCSGTEIHQPGKKAGTISFDIRVPADAPRYFKGKEMLPIRLEVGENAEVTPDVIYGMINTVDYGVDNDGLQVESVSITKYINWTAPA